MKKLEKLNRPQETLSLRTNDLWLTALLLALCFVFLSPGESKAGSRFGVGYYAGPTSGPTVSYALSTKNTIKLIAPLSFNNVVADYQYRIKGFSKGKFRFNVYVGVGTDVALSGSGNVNKKKEDKEAKADANGSGSFAASLRIPVGLSVSMARYPIDIFAEVAPQVELYNGNEFGFDGSKIDWTRIGIGARYHF